MLELELVQIKVWISLANKLLVTMCSSRKKHSDDAQDIPEKEEKPSSK